MAFQCTKCELVFANRTELETHLALDHESPATPDDLGETAAGAGQEEPSEHVGAEPQAPEPHREPPPVAPGERRGLFARLRGRGREKS